MSIVPGLQITINSQARANVAKFCCVEMELAIRENAIGLREHRGKWRVTLEPWKLPIRYCPFCCRIITTVSKT